MLAEAGVNVGVMVAPVIPGLNDHEIANILSEAKLAGAIAAGYVLLRLPLTVEPVFREWVQRMYPQQEEKILGRVQQTRGGKMNSSDFGSRMTGEGEIAQQIQSMFHLFCKKHDLVRKMPPLDCDHFRPPEVSDDQMRLF
jgi:DNA repair photolyase